MKKQNLLKEIDDMKYNHSEEIHRMEKELNELRGSSRKCENALERKEMDLIKLKKENRDFKATVPEDKGWKHLGEYDINVLLEEIRKKKKK